MPDSQPGLCQCTDITLGRKHATVLSSVKVKLIMVRGDIVGVTWLGSKCRELTEGNFCLTVLHDGFTRGHGAVRGNYLVS